MKKTDHEVTLLYPSSIFAVVWRSFESNKLTWVSSLSNKYPWGSNPPSNHTPESIIEIRQHTERFSNMVNTRQKHGKCCTCKQKLYNENQQEAHYQQYQPISMNEGLFPHWILPLASWDHAEPSWFNYRWCTWMPLTSCQLMIYS